MRRFWLNGALVASDEGPLASQRAYFCPTCGEVWGRVSLDSPTEDWRWTAWHVPCPRHPAGWLYPAGSFWTDCNSPFTSSLPEAVLRREFNLHMAHYDRYFAPFATPALPSE